MGPVVAEPHNEHAERDAESLVVETLECLAWAIFGEETAINIRDEVLLRLSALKNFVETTTALNFPAVVAANYPVPGSIGNIQVPADGPTVEEMIAAAVAKALADQQSSK